MTMQRVSRRSLLGWASAIAMLPVLAACGAPAAPTSAPATPAPAKPAEAPKPAAEAPKPAAEAPKPAAPTAEATKPSVAAAAPAAGAKPGGSLAGTKLLVLAGNSFVPAQDKLVDDMVAALGQQTGMDAKVDRPGAQMSAK